MTPQEYSNSKAVNALNNTAFSIFQKVSSKASDADNIFISPYSISTALAMVYPGARNHTKAEMEKVLNFIPDIDAGIGALAQTLKSTPQEFAEINAANALWPSTEAEILPDYAKRISHNFNADIVSLNYKENPAEAAATINQWTAKETKNKINNIISDISSDTSLILTNAVYFNAKWDNKFDEPDTRPKLFNTLSGKKTKVPMMFKQDKVHYAQMDKFEIAELPYKDSRFSMFIMLPSKKNKLQELITSCLPQSISKQSNINKLQKLLNYDSFQKCLKKLELVDADIYIPKFKQESEYNLSDTLADMGMSSAFSKKHADLFGITPRTTPDGDEKYFYISDIRHKAFIDVGESGTEAAGVTSILFPIAVSCITVKPKKKVIFKADRPFIYLIRDNLTKTIMFIGRFVQP